ncbi:MAG: DNA methyltransferase [Candidatus Sericytochromatia bacterium]
MALSWNEIKDRAIKFSKEWETASNERSESQTFWYEFFNIFGIHPRRVATFEKPVKKSGNKQGFIDLFWKGTILVEHKSKGKNLEKAFEQAKDYFPGLKDEELPKYILVSDFEKFNLYDLDLNKEYKFELSELHKNVELFGFIAGYQKRTYRESDPVNIKAAELMGKLHDKLKEIGYVGHELEMYLVRLLFCLFADDTSIFEKDIFLEYLEIKTKEDGSDLASHIHHIFQILNTPKEKRLKNLDEHLTKFPYVNGKLFEENLSIASFDTEMRKILIDACYLDWGQISPAIFGSLFQSVMKPEERRNLGAHYTSEKNIMKLIKPLFLDELYKDFENVKNNRNKLNEFHEKLGKLKFLDPACGCGNFLVVTYREIRLLELQVLKEIYKHALEVGELMMDISIFLKVNVDQVYGIEYEEFPARIASVAMWLIDHQMNMKVSTESEFGQYFVRIPLKKSANIVYADALETDWENLVSIKELSYIIGNPPFIGSNIMKQNQRDQIIKYFDNASGGGTLDYVTGWYIKAAKFIQNTKIKVAFVSTNSIVQGEQTNLLWGLLQNKYNIKIHFAHRTFKWNNEAKGNAAVYCVIIGFANYDTTNKSIFDYEDIKGEAHEIKAKNINAYLVDAKDILVGKKKKPICNVPEIIKGNYYAKSEGLIIEEQDLEFFLTNEPNAKKWVKLLIGADEFINNKKRYCLWLVDCPPDELRKMPLVMERVNRVREDRLKSTDKGIKNLVPTLFRETNNPEKCLVIPVVSSERRKYIPMGFIDKNTISTNGNLIMPNAELFHFGILMSTMHMAWVKYTCGRLKSDFRYSKDIVYNNFPFPENPTDKQIKQIEDKAQKVLDARKEFLNSSLADLYDPLSMPPKLVKAHQELDKVVDLCYRSQSFDSEAKRIEFLFELYNIYNEPLLNLNKEKKKKSGGKKNEMH